ncbi:DUF3718 domain-containing protein [Rheinheimera sp.]|uniref:DUF3718 domain-containing protein n=1 Tax=Rheinheimera sp. TaxID=1869214 RepID=UPI002734B70D|nr:DUF3718 domain-containing protein [Rheinheimera sp.]MDP2713728.1 DUF3718 domain-containing protein [Rheinheimera sp.]
MKKIVLTLAALCVINTAMANEQIAETLCGYIKEDNRNQLRKTLSENKLNVRNIYSSIKCNNESMLQFAIRHDAFESGSFIVKQMPSKTLAEFDYAAWAGSNGLEASALVDVIKTRIGE